MRCAHKMFIAVTILLVSMVAVFAQSGGGIELQVKKVVFFPFTVGGFNSFIDQIEITVR